jgi:hypothetical protein
MSNNFAPNVVRDGLVMLLDAANPKSYNPAENLLTYSDDTSNYQYIENASVTTNTITSPYNTVTADTLTSTVTGGSNTCLVQKYLAVSANTQTYTFSVFLQAGTSPTTTINMQLAGGTYQQSVATITWASNTITSSSGGTSYITSYGNGWYRVGITLTNNGTNNAAYPRVYVKDQGTSNVSGQTVYVWGWQLETGGYMNTYTPVATTATVTRSTTWTDLTGTSNNVTLANIPSFTGTTFLFNGTNQWCYNAAPTLPAGKLNSTCLCWCRPDSTVTADTYVGLVSYGTRSSSDARLMSFWTNNTTAYTSSAYWGNDYVPQATAIALNAWNMVGMQAYGAPTTNNTTLLSGNTAVINYSTGSSSAYTAGLNTTSINLAVASTDYPGRYFKGQIAVVMFYNRALTTDEIQQNYYAYRGRFSI